uniref:Pept_C1 domain-containing protein n=1 Tax=Caenorhabditis tropicalis TaxID=1561998 RepID=A0A1I7TRF8_9PELO
MVSAIIFNDEKTPCKGPDRLVDAPRQSNVQNRKKVRILPSSYFCVQFLSGVVLLTMLVLLGVIVFKRFESKMENVKYKEMFNEFILKYDRKYESVEELQYRYSIFLHNVKEFEAEEERNLGLDYDVNEFTDWTDDELRRMVFERSDIKDDTPRFEGSYIETGVKRPASIDWRDQGKLTPIKNQGQCGSCWAFATVAAVEAQHAIKKGSLVSLSEQELVDCDFRDNGCSGGYRPYAMRFVKENGLETEKEYPYSASKHDQCFLKQNVFLINTRVFINDYEMLSSHEEDIANWVGTKGPVTFGMEVTKAMYSYRSGIFNPSVEDCTQKSMGSHALTIVGYGGEGESSYWIVKNSWGTSWGASGYFRLARGVNSCGMAKTVVAPIIN